MSPSIQLLDDNNLANGNGTATTPGHDALANTTKSAVLHRSLNKDPPRVIGAKGMYIHLSNGQDILDATGGAAVTCLGHGDVRVQRALVEQMNEISYCHSPSYSTNAVEDLAKLLVDSTHGEMARVFFASSGSEAMEAALKLARQYHLDKSGPEPERAHFIARKQSYHGTTLGALAVGGHVHRRSMFEPILSQNTSQVSPCYAYRGLASMLENEAAYVKRLESELESEFQRVGPTKVAAFVAEPVVGAALGCVPPSPGYFKAVRRICDKYGALLIFDEVMSGSGRIGPEPSERYAEPLHAYQDPLIGVTPDIMSMGKGLGGGYMPIAAILASRKVVETLRQGTGAFMHGQTYQAHPLACRAALEVQRIVQNYNLIANVRKQGSLLGTLLREKLAKHPAVGDIRGKGLFWGVELVRDKTTKEPFDPSEAVAMEIHELGMQEPYNISIYPGSGSVDGKRGDHVLLAPAYNISSEDIAMIVDTFSDVLRQYFMRNHREWWILKIANMDASAP